MFTGRIKAVNDIRGDGTIDLTTDFIGHGTMCGFNLLHVVHPLKQWD